MTQRAIFNLACPLFDLLYFSIMENKSSQRRQPVTTELISNFIRSIQSMHFVRTKRYLTAYGGQLINKLQQQSRMPPIFFALQLSDSPTSLEFIEQLFKYRPNLHFRDSFGNTFLHHCCYFDNISAFKLLAERGVDVSVKNIYRQSILFAIAKNNNQQILQYLIKYQQQRKNCESILEVNDTDTYGRTPLFYAAEQGNLAICEIFIKIGALVDIKDTQGHQAQFYARKYAKFEVTALLSSFRKEESLPTTRALEELFTYNLTFLDEKFEPKILTVNQLLEFVKDNQQLRGMLENPETIEETVDQQDWREQAKKVVKKCLLQNGSQYFSEPVIEECFGITDYYEVIKNPMDFLTISKKLTYNGYERKEEFERDVERIYENCVTYNGAEHMISLLAANIVKFFKSNWKY